MLKLVIVDVETSTGNPTTASMIQLGAVVYNLSENKIEKGSFVVEIKPYNNNWETQAENIHHLTREHLNVNGLDLSDSLCEFNNWLKGKGFKDIRKETFLAQWSCGFDSVVMQNAYTNAKKRYPFSYRSIDVASFVRMYLWTTGLLKRKDKAGLAACAKLLGIKLENVTLHDAKTDALLAAAVLSKVVGKLKEDNNAKEWSEDYRDFVGFCTSIG
jgi:DNA polymerase III epsilon subunit-like protein